MSVKDSPGFYDKTKRKVVFNEERMKQLNYKRPNNFKEYDNDPIGVFIWGDETPEELVEKIIKQESHHRSGVGLIIFSIFNFKNEMQTLGSSNSPCQTLVECFEILKQRDTNTYNEFKKTEILKRLGLEKKSSAQGCLIFFIIPPLLYMLTLIH
tara:strand:+ start:626 stop:1087 length:462 start_codon:yes stop_codon:yes gene_type:complete